MYSPEKISDPGVPIGVFRGVSGSNIITASSGVLGKECNLEAPERPGVILINTSVFIFFQIFFFALGKMNKNLDCDDFISPS